MSNREEGYAERLGPYGEPESNEAFELRVRGAIAMLNLGVAEEEVLKRHGSFVLKKAWAIIAKRQEDKEIIRQEAKEIREVV